MPKDTGKKLADMLYGQNPEQAAFGVYPQMKGRRSKQDPEAAKNVPVDLLRGAVSGVLGAPGDIESLIRLLPGLDERTILPTSEDIEGRLPFKSDTPVSRAATTVGQLGGGFYTGPGSPLRLAGALPGAVKRAGQDFAMAAGQSGANVIKPKGGNWLTGNVEKQLGRMKMADYTTPEQFAEMQQSIDAAKRIMGNDPTVQRTVAQMENEIDVAKRNNAINKWIDSNLANYVKKEMGTPEDPVRKLAEQDILHIKPIGDQYQVSSRLMSKRKGAGFNPLGEGKNEAARFWERQADISLEPYPAGSYKHGALDESLLEANPWLKNVPDEEMIYYSKGLNDLGFDHIIDVLRQDVREGRIRPEQLNKVSMEQAVRRTYEYDQEMAKKMREAQVKATEGMPVYKEYPEGFRWVELAGKKSKPEIVEMEGGGWTIKDNTGHLMSGGFKSKEGAEKALAQLSKTDKRYKEGISQESEKALEDALKYEGETMGHCVGGYCPDVLEGRSRIFSLRDAKGEPHVTIEVEPAPRIGFREGEGPKTPEERFDLQTEWLKGVESGKIGGDVTFANWWRQKNNIPEPELPFQISQIKGKQNRAPKEDYLPFVQDFVKSGQWSDVGDLQNTGLIRRGNVFTPTEKQGLIDLGQDVPEYLTQEDIARLRRARGDLPPEEGMAHGGSVHISDNPDVMQMELAGGGLVSKLAKLARAPAKTKQEIEAIAERIAPQVTGEYVRSKPGSAITVAGKTKKQFEREKSLPVDIRATAAERVPEPVDIEKLKGEVMIGIPGDPTVTGKTLHGVGDVRLESPAPQHGGPLYGLYHDDDHFWASGLGAARRVQNLAKEAGEQYDAPVVGKYVMMGPESINYAQHFADSNLQAIDLSKMTKKQVEQFNKLIRQGSPASGPRPSFPGIEDKESAYLQMAMDPELRKHFNQLMQQNTVTEALNLPSGQDIRFAITEPPLRDLETGVTGFSMGRMRPDIPAAELKLSEHPTYSHDIPGHFMGQTAYPVPYELSFPDTLKAIRENPKQAPHEFGSLKMVGPRQTIDQQLIDELKMYEERMKALTGKADGGEVHGLSSQDMLFLQSQDDLAKLSPQAQREYITNMGGQELRQRMAPKYADGGEITADDLILEERKL